jgi:hypothetical protein
MSVRLEIIPVYKLSTNKIINEPTKSKHGYKVLFKKSKNLFFEAVWIRLQLLDTLAVVARNVVDPYNNCKKKKYK